MPLNIKYNKKDLLHHSNSENVLVDLPANGLIELFPQLVTSLPPMIIKQYKKACINGTFTPGKTITLFDGPVAYYLVCNRWADFGESYSIPERVLAYTTEALKKLSGSYATVILGKRYNIWGKITQLKLDNNISLDVYVRSKYGSGN